MRKLMVGLAMAGLLTAGCTTTTGTPASGPSPQPGGAVSTMSVDCSKVPAEADMPKKALASGAVRISLCNEPGFEWAERVAPPDALVKDTQVVIDVVNTLEDLLPVMACTADLGPAYRLVIEYPDGSTVNLRGELFGCRAVGGQVLRDGPASENVLAAFATALRTQRASLPVKVDHPLESVTCAALNAWVTPDPADTIGGFGCELPGGDGDRLPIADADWTTLRADVAANSAVFDHTAPMPECLVAPGPALVGVNEVGEPVTFSPSCAGWMWTSPDGVDRLWTPSEEALAVLATVS